eukprot:CAMPEP_0180739740 /NCGR_PEP_ID=MMETSP1038_2-20121128/25500_1 /TAXON_ID=632150 /ORGANISM="Azadinium spinosum, Strain 3D9" /LENGTH=107 /DNA_ID=CAMNT_0022772959 /DNA_START=643 /DNA_END=963 /DNA_ORIENTATION=+
MMRCGRLLRRRRSTCASISCINGHNANTRARAPNQAALPTTQRRAAKGRLAVAEADPGLAAARSRRRLATTDAALSDPAVAVEDLRTLATALKARVEASAKAPAMGQ